MTVMEMPSVHQCSVSGCSYNHDAACAAGAITITGSDAACATFIDLGSVGGLGSPAAGKVGACHRTDCAHNDGLECTAESISVGAGHDVADCLTYQSA